VREHRRFFWQLATEIEITFPNQCYSISIGSIQRNGGEGMVRRYYCDSPRLFISSIQPEHQWHSWLFYCTNPPKFIWNDPNTHRHFFNWIEEKLGIIKGLESWYNVKKETIWRYGGETLLRDHYENSIFQFVTRNSQSNFNWEIWRFVGEKEKRDRVLVEEKHNVQDYFDWLKKRENNMEELKRERNNFLRAARIHEISENQRWMDELATTQSLLQLAISELFRN